MATKIIASPEGSSASTSTPQRLQIGSNNSHDIVFSSAPDSVAQFAVTHGRRIAALLRVLQAYDGEEAYSDDVLALTADMAWELEQATALLAAQQAGGQHG